MVRNGRAGRNCHLKRTQANRIRQTGHQGSAPENEARFRRNRKKRHLNAKTRRRKESQRGSDRSEADGHNRISFAFLRGLGVFAFPVFGFF